MIDILYSNSDAIRSAIGIDEDDVSDEMLSKAFLEDQMLDRLEKVLANHADIAFSSESIERKLRLWCQFFGGLQIIELGLLSIASKMQANTDQMSRFNIDWEAMKASLNGKLTQLELDLKATQKTLLPISVNIFGKASPGYDPVTGV